MQKPLTKLIPFPINLNLTLCSTVKIHIICISTTSDSLMFSVKVSIADFASLSNADVWKV